MTQCRCVYSGPNCGLLYSRPALSDDLCSFKLSTQRGQWHPTPVLLPGKSYGWRSLVGCSPWGHWESDRTEQLPFHFSLSCIGEGNGNPLQCSCLENPRDGGAWWASVYGVAQSRTRLKRLSSSSKLSATAPGCSDFSNSSIDYLTWVIASLALLPCGFDVWLPAYGRDISWKIPRK